MRLLLTGILAAAGCGSAGPERSDHEPLRVAAAIEPIAFLVERVAGPYAQVEVLIPAGADAHTFQLSPRQMTELAKADLCFRVGLALEDRMLEKVRQSRPDFPV
ncbi:MAG TPA: zinc ABC transporter substrate-binding protein, partial [Thermoguttaceae bacterium]|nr:zinc ABC transporter substrate-binding protein [Thermoguttaceae bacterium]